MLTIGDDENIINTRRDLKSCRIKADTILKTVKLLEQQVRLANHFSRHLRSSSK